MIKTYCDLCGNEVAENTGYHMALFDNEMYHKADMGMFTGLSDKDAIQTYDVCDNCKQRLAEFMRGLRG